MKRGSKIISGSKDWIKEYHIAHRGLFLAGSVREENSLAAIEAAVERGYAVEIDVRVTADGIVVAHHDATIERLTEHEGKVSLMSYNELSKIPIGWTEKPMPMLSDVLEIVDRRVPLFIEVKTDPDENIQAVCAGIRYALEGYNGPIAIMSFDERILKWFKGYNEQIVRGMVIGREKLLSIRNRIGLMFSTRFLKPDFLACDFGLLPNSLTEKWRERGQPVLAWTIRHVDMEDIAMKYADRMIFEEPAVTGEVTDI